MTRIDQIILPRKTTNRQTERTRAAIRAAFSELVFSKRYGDIHMSDVAELANVGRSTLYLHYRDKDALLIDNMAPLLDGLAGALGVEDNDRPENALRHIWEHRDRGRIVLFGKTGQKLERAFADRVMQDLPAQASQRVTVLFVANQIAASVFSVMRTWLQGDASASVEAIARHICESSRALSGR